MGIRILEEQKHQGEEPSLKPLGGNWEERGQHRARPGTRRHLSHPCAIKAKYFMKKPTCGRFCQSIWGRGKMCIFFTPFKPLGKPPQRIKVKQREGRPRCLRAEPPALPPHLPRLPKQRFENTLVRKFGGRPSPPRHTIAISTFH